LLDLGYCRRRVGKQGILLAWHFRPEVNASRHPVGWEILSLNPQAARVKKTERKMGGHSSSRRSRAPRRGIMQIASRILPPRHATQAETNCGARLSARRYSRGSFPPVCQQHPRARGLRPSYARGTSRPRVRDFRRFRSETHASPPFLRFLVVRPRHRSSSGLSKIVNRWTVRCLVARNETTLWRSIYRGKSRSRTVTLSATGAYQSI